MTLVIYDADEVPKEFLLIWFHILCDTSRAVAISGDYSTFSLSQS